MEREQLLSLNSMFQVREFSCSIPGWCSRRSLNEPLVFEAGASGCPAEPGCILVFFMLRSSE